MVYLELNYWLIHLYRESPVCFAWWCSLQNLHDKWKISFFFNEVLLFMVTAKPACLQISKISKGEESSLFICGFVLRFLAQYYNTFFPFWLVIFCLGLTRVHNQNHSWVWEKLLLLCLWMCKMKQEYSCWHKVSNSDQGS